MRTHDGKEIVCIDNSWYVILGSFRRQANAKGWAKAYGHQWTRLPYGNSWRWVTLRPARTDELPTTPDYFYK